MKRLNLFIIILIIFFSILIANCDFFSVFIKIPKKESTTITSSSTTTLPHGSLDTGFGTGGKVTTPIGINEEGYSVAIQSDGKIVVAGCSNNGSNDDFAVVRYNSDGSLDNGFGTGGKVTTPIGIGDDYGTSVAIQNDGKIVVAGYSYNGSNYDFAVVRYNSDGALDTGFDGDGIVTTPIGINEEGYSVAIQSDGKIVVAGCSNNGSNYDFAVVRYNSDGSLDNGFDGDGKVTTPIGTGDDYGTSVAIQNDGKIVVAGYSYNGSNYDFAVVRYNSDGSLDNGFDGDGIVTTPIGSGHDKGYSVAIQNDGKIVVAGCSNNGSNDDFAVVRYNTNGSLDTDFGTGGKVTTPIGINEGGFSVAIQSDGKIVVAGCSNNGSNNDFAVVRYNANGSLDTGFDGDGIVTTPIGSGYDQGYSVAIQSDGKIVVAGFMHNGSNYDFAVVRYNP